MSSSIARENEQVRYRENDLNMNYIKAPNFMPMPIYAPSTVANPGPLGLCSFAAPLFVLSLHLVGAGLSPTGPSNVTTGLGIFYGGITEILAGMWEFRTGNTFGATTFTSYGGFWMSFAAMSISGFNIIESYSVAPPSTLKNSLGFYFLGWTIFTGVMMIASHRSSIGLCSMFVGLFITFTLLTASKFNESVSTQVASGVFGLITSIIAWYNGMSGLLTEDSSFFVLPTGRIR